MEYDKNITKVDWQEKTVYLLGTAHVSKQSVVEVREACRNLSPDTVCVELCKNRLESIRNADRWKNMDIFRIIKEKKAVMLFAQLILSSFYRKLGKELEVTPGAEMIEGVHQAEQDNRELILADRDIQITLKRVWGNLSFFEKIRLLAHLLPSLLFHSDEKIDHETVEELKNKDHLEHAMEEFTHEFPRIQESLIHERDMHLAEKIKSATGTTILAVVGAGHVPGIARQLFEENDLDAITHVPPPSLLPRLITWGFPLLIIALIAYGFVTGGSERGGEMLLLWVLLNGTLSAVGTLLAGAHILTILTAFVAAPLTSLNPTIGAGYITGLVQTILKRPTVADMEAVPEATESMRGLWKNPLTRILLVFIFSSLGSSLASLAYPFVLAFRLAQ
ncbi:TraB/GumN family protein [Chitinivibrio alkaliphilus]|uniref:TraB family protein n=1 Tax=Chitinivibrio alkaliphilus ACht1 TaxID=1313304 RepID=U7D7V8_9BACT|nr:TraB/GumN family protein [Chitinivibrio alkaliphilus]ERP32023.1 TraB family protein [Chitinivibrio alkaliphilus ACht1]